MIARDVRLACPFCKVLLMVPAEQGALVDCPSCDAPLSVRAEVAGHSLQACPSSPRLRIVSTADVDLALDHLRS